VLLVKIVPIHSLALGLLKALLHNLFEHLRLQCFHFRLVLHSRVIGLLILYLLIPKPAKAVILHLILYIAKMIHINFVIIVLLCMEIRKIC